MSQQAEELIAQSFGTDVRRRRNEKRISQEALAALAGTTKNNIIKIENGHIPKVPLVYALARALGANLWDLLPPDPEGFERSPVQGQDGAAPGGFWVARESNSDP